MTSSGLALISNPVPVGFVYLIGPQAGPTAKIGRSIDTAARLATIQRMSPVKLVVRWQHPGDHRLEQALHRHFADRRSHGEWFDFGREDPVKCVAQVVKKWIEPPRPPGRQRWGMLRQEGLYFAIPREYWFSDDGSYFCEERARQIDRALRGTNGPVGDSPSAEPAG